MIIALAVSSCSQTPSVCGPSNCDGCCTSTGACAPPTLNAADSTCGTNGSACVNCTLTGGTCSTSFTCVVPDAGTSACNPSTCPNGCCSSDGQCHPAASTAQSEAVCGNLGASCLACTPGFTCKGGVCTAPPDAGPPAAIGDPCTMDSQCASLGAHSRCFKTTALGATYPGGFCSIDCISGAALCGATAICANIGVLLGDDGAPRCMPKCSVAAQDCRAGYECLAASATIGVCYIANPVWVPDAGRAADKIGNDCTAHSQCRAPPDAPYDVLGSCILAVGANGAATPFTGGYCTADCTVYADVCGPNGICQDISGGAGTRKTCFQRCVGPGTGRGTCKPNYVCGDALDVDAGIAVDGFCRPDCHQPSSCTGGKSCGTGDAGYCQ